MCPLSLFRNDQSVHGDPNGICLSRSLEKDRAICACTHLGLDFRADIIAAQCFAEFFADPTGRAAEASAVDRYAIFPRVIDQIDQRWQSDALNILPQSWGLASQPNRPTARSNIMARLSCALRVQNASVAFVGSSEPLVAVT